MEQCSSAPRTTPPGVVNDTHLPPALLPACLRGGGVTSSPSPLHLLLCARVEPEHLLRSAACTVGAQKVTTDKRQARSLSGPGEQRTVQSVQTEFQWRTHDLLRLDFPGLFDIRLAKGNIHGTVYERIKYCSSLSMCATLLNASSSRSLPLVGCVGRMVVRRPKEVERSGFGIPFPIIGILLLLLHPLPGGGDGRVQSGALERTKKKKKVSQEGERTQIRPRPRERDGGRGRK